MKKTMKKTAKKVIQKSTNRPSKPANHYFLKTVKSDGKSYGGFKWPLKVGAKITAKDWNPKPVCGGGFHGLLNGEGDGNLLRWDKDARWIVFSSDSYVDLGGKAKVKTATVRHVGDRLSATEYLKKHSDGKAIVGASCTAGDYGTATAGYSGTATAGNDGTATAGDRGTATAGYNGTATAGHSGTATAGNGGIIQIAFYDGRNRILTGYIGETLDEEGNVLVQNMEYYVSNGAFRRTKE